MTDVVMPQMGESIVEGTLTKWLKKPGERVERDEPLFEISTDKVDTEIPSPVAGTLAEVLVEEGKTVGINTVVGRISDGAGSGSSAAAAAAAPSSQPEAPVAPTAPATPEPSRKTQEAEAQQPPGEDLGAPLSPLVRKMARENNIDLSRIKGTGAGGRITKQDLEAHLGSRSAAPAEVSVARQPQTVQVPPPPPPA